MNTLRSMACRLAGLYRIVLHFADGHVVTFEDVSYVDMSKYGDFTPTWSQHTLLGKGEYHFVEE